MKIDKKTESHQKTALLMLAAGRSTRALGFNKLSREINGVPLLTHCYNAIKNSKVDQIVIISSRENYQQATKLNSPCPEVTLLNTKSDGLGHSISHGMTHLHKDISSVIICLSDTPLVSAIHIDLLIKSNKISNYNGIQRIYDVNDTPGHPVLFNKEFFLKLSKLRSDKDPMILINENIKLLTKIKVNNLSPTTDLDSEEAWAIFEASEL